MSVLISKVQDIIPALTSSLHKGQCGKIGVVGGSAMYCGAPFYSATAALKTGADLACIVCTSSAAVPLKSMSPEFIVSSHLLEFKGEVSDSLRSDLEQWLSRQSSIVIGPGLGRDKATLSCAKYVLSMACDKSMPVVVDADGLWLLSKSQEALSMCAKNPWCVLTPNAVEARRLCDEKLSLRDLSTRKQINLLVKGSTDTLYAPSNDGQPLPLSLIAEQAGPLIDYFDTAIHPGHDDFVDTRSSHRRCGGQGDVLAGTLAVFLSWAHRHTNANHLSPRGLTPSQAVVRACLGSSILVRQAARRAFDVHKRATTTPDIIDQLGPTFEYLWPSESYDYELSAT